MQRKMSDIAKGKQKSKGKDQVKGASTTNKHQVKTLGLSDYFTLFDVTDDHALPIGNLTTLQVHERSIRIISDAGCSHAWISIHATTLTNEAFDENSFLRDFLIANKCFLLISDAETDVTLKNPDVQHSLEYLIISQKATRLKGKILAIMMMISELEPDISAASHTANKILNSIRIAHGINAAGDRVAGFLYNGINNTVSQDQITTYVFQEEVKGNVDGSAYIQFKDHMEKYPEAFLMSSEADVMFSYALSEKEPWRRFLFLWLCLECSHNGKQRKNLFEIKLGSTTVNNEVIRLYEIRHNLFHEGHAIIEKEDCTSLLWAIRIAICKDGTTQIAMCKLYEVWIGERYARYVSG